LVKKSRVVSTQVSTAVDVTLAVGFRKSPTLPQIPPDTDVTHPTVPKKTGTGAIHE
jgi:hypothetical protein